MKDLKKWLVTVCTAAIPLLGWSQLDPQRSQYMYGTAAYNPGSIAQNDMCNVLGIYRLQWAGFSGAPTDVVVAGDVPFTLGGSKHGVGINFQKETIGLFENQSVNFQYSYKLPLWKGNLGLGLNIGFISQDFDYDGVDLTGNGKEPVSGDSYHKNVELQSGGEQNGDMAFTVGVGAYYSDDDLYAGLSVLNLNKPSFDFGKEEETNLPRLLHLMGGYDFALSNEDYHLKPSAYYRTDFSTSQVDMTCLLDVKKKYFGGLGYRLGDSFEFLIGANLINGLFLGYAYDLPVSGMIKSGGSHEVCLKYSFKLELAKKNKYKSERIL